MKEPKNHNRFQVSCLEITLIYLLFCFPQETNPKTIAINKRYFMIIKLNPIELLQRQVNDLSNNVCSQIQKVPRILKH